MHRFGNEQVRLAGSRSKETHDHLRHVLHGALGEALADTDCRILPAPCPMLHGDAFCTMLDAEEHDGIAPDIAVVCGRDPRVPTLVVEILEPETLLRDTTRHLHLYEVLRVQEYWIVDAAGLLVHAFRLNHEHKLKLYQSAAPGEVLESRALPGLRLPAWQNWLENPA
ncbi:Uma2 family endonuclease [Megalodesulfovibrio paquesii]